MTRLIDQTLPPSHPLEEDSPYGWRYVSQTQPDGTTEYVRILLTPEDVLHPQEGDFIAERTVQEMERGYLTWVCRYQLRENPSAMVTSDCLIDWGVEGIKASAPDVCVFDSVREPNADYNTFPMVEQGARSLLATEFVSVRDRDPRSRNNDVVHKFREYYRIGIPLYLIVDQEREKGPRALRLYRHTPAGYQLIPPDAQGRVLLEPVHVLVGLRDNRIVCFNAATGEEFPDYGDAIQAQRAAEDKLRAEEEARKSAEDKLRVEEKARKSAEDKLRALEEELQRLRSQAGTGPSS
jgi:Uma2 family endonuclease